MPPKVEDTPPPGLSPVAGRPLIARFDGGQMSSDGGLLALRKVEQRLGLADRLAACIDDPRAPERVRHGLAAILRFRMLMIAAGYEDGNSGLRARADQCAPTGRPSTTSGDAPRRERASGRSSAVSSASSRARSSGTSAAAPGPSTQSKSPLDVYRSIGASPIKVTRRPTPVAPPLRRASRALESADAQRHPGRRPHRAARRPAGDGTHERPAPARQAH